MTHIPTKLIELRGRAGNSNLNGKKRTHLAVVFGSMFVRAHIVDFAGSYTKIDASTDVDPPHTATLTSRAARVEEGGPKRLSQSGISMPPEWSSEQLSASGPRK